ncbi:hypothetical protein HO614_05970 [Streptococcus suis]|nr:hypothetical protein [Streptococcus suis]
MSRRRAETLKTIRKKVLGAGIGIRLSWTQSSLNHPKKITHSKAIILAQAYTTTGGPGKSGAVIRWE